MSLESLPAKASKDLADAYAAIRVWDDGDGESLSHWLYQAWFQDGGTAESWPKAGDYAAAVNLPELFQPGWKIAKVGPDGLQLHHSDGRSELALPGSVLPEPATSPMRPGTRVLRLALTSTVVPGYWQLWSAGWGTRELNRLVRLYLPLTPQAMLGSVEFLARRAPPDAVWTAKFLCGSQATGRRDSGLLYLPEGDETVDWVQALLLELAPALTGPPIRLAAPFLGGAWRAVDPGDGRSFGQALCATLADVADDAAVLDSAAAFTAAAWLRVAPLVPHLLSTPGGGDE